MSHMIRVKYVTNASGAGRIRVQYKNRTRTYPYQHGLGYDRNVVEALRDFRDEWNIEVRHNPNFSETEILDPTHYNYVSTSPPRGKGWGSRHYPTNSLI